MRWVDDFQLFLFDVDGLLVDTEGVHYQAYVNTMASLGYRLEWSFGKYCELAHINATAIKEGLYADFPDLDPNWEGIYEKKKQAYLTLLSSASVKLMPGVQELLEILKEKNIQRCAVTHSLLEQVLLIRLRLPILDTIPHWITREDYEKPKPDPECYLKAIQLYGKEGDRIIGFEDSVRGLKALRGTSALPVLICPPHHSLLDIAMEGGGVYFESFDKISEEKLATR